MYLTDIPEKNWKNLKQFSEQNATKLFENFEIKV